jgi:uncharacterized protein
MFDQKTIEQLEYYVYVLIDSRSNKPFYVGKGIGNRVFNHLQSALEEETDNDKYNLIRSIILDNCKVKHLIVRHGLTEKQAFEIESTLIDLLDYLNFEITNRVLGHHAYQSGIMTTDEIIRLYNAEPLTQIEDSIIFININKQYKRGFSVENIYQATKASWVIAKHKIEKLKFVLSEYRGLIVEVFEVDEWYEVPTVDKNGKDKIRWGFNGKVAPDETRRKYINKSVNKKGYQTPIYYKLSNK